MDFEFRHQSETLRVVLGDGEHLLGRSAEAGLRIPVRDVSSLHARLRIAGDRLWIRELGSKNGTTLAGRALRPEDGEVEVLPGQRLEVASIEIRHRAPSSSGDSASRDDDTALSFSIDSPYRDTARGRITAELSGLFELIAAEDGPEALADRACEFVSRCVRADSVVLLEDHGEGTAPQPRGSWSASGKATDELRLSRTLVARVVGERTSVLFRRVDGDPGQASDSIVALGIRSAMAVPLFDNQRVRGILYVDSVGGMQTYGEDELQLVTATANAVAVKLRNLSMEREQASAAEIQRSMLPAALPPVPGHELLVYIDMCRAVGGDLYQVLPFGEGHFLIALGDVTGKGVPAALVMSACTVLIGALAELCDSPAAIAQQLQRQLFKVLRPTQFVTLFLGDLDPATGLLRYLNAGHEPPLRVRSDGTLEFLAPTAPPVAMFAEFAARSAEIQLAPGELLAVFTDGIAEATRDGQVYLGLEGLRRQLATRREEPLSAIRDAVIAEVQGFLGENRPSDDVSLLLLRRLGNYS